ncbi:centromere-associated protein E isoform X2 [Ambystoma mexicanum]|uniref:centromere-associated protein E isoform X2 n=1 Tax=Ambystoma mexicanum TaxID=8296 RepID=UPI0037E885BA
MAEEGAVKVCLRVRPLIQREKNKQQADSVALCWKTEGNSILQIDGTKSFSFDRVFHSEESTEKVYQEMAIPIINSAIQGYNGTIFAYGQTSSGKTYTMMGSSTSCGVIPQAIHDVFKVVKEIPSREFLLRVSYMEIYNETVTDLLCDDRKKKPLEIREDLNRNVYVADLTEELVVIPQHVMEWIKKGEKNRHYGQTKMNERSSRSHTIFRMIVESRERTDPANSENWDGAVMVSHLNLVDLAGSERASQTGAEGLRLKEGCNINRSLFILGQVIKKLSDGQVGGFINYRDSKLTRILQNSLGGNAKTVIICTVTPVSYDETLSTLQFASTAKNMKNTPHVNEVLDDEALLKRYRQEVLDLKKQLEDLQTSSENRANTMAVDERAQLLEEIKRLQIEKEERTRNLNKIVVIPSSHVSQDDFRSKRKRRVTWAPGKLASSLSSTDDFGIGCLNTTNISKRPKFASFQSVPEMDDSDVSEFDELSRTVDEGILDTEWNPAIQLLQQEKLFSCQAVLNYSCQGMKHQSSVISGLEMSSPKTELDVKVESLENELMREQSAEIENNEALQIEISNLQQKMTLKDQENSEVVKRLEIIIAELEQKLQAQNETKYDSEETHPSEKPAQSLEDPSEKQSQDGFKEQISLEEEITLLEDPLRHEHVEVPPAESLETELQNKFNEDKLLLEHKIMDLEDMIERMTNVDSTDGETQKCNEDFKESVQICEALMLEKGNALNELHIMRDHFDSVVLENESLKQEINHLQIQLMEKKELSEFEILEIKAQREQEIQLEAKSNELNAKGKLLKDRENTVANLEKLVGSLQKQIQNFDLSVSMGSTDRFCEEIHQLKQSLSDAETVTKDAQKESAFLRSENIDLKEKMCELSDIDSQMKKDVNMYKSQLESEKARYKKMYVDLQKELQYAFNEIAQLNSLMDGKVPKDLLSRVDLERNITDLKKQLDKALEEKSELQTEVNLLSEHKSLPTKVERLKKQVCEISEELCGITAEKDMLVLTLNDRESQNKILMDSLEKAEEHLASLQPKYEQTQQEYFELMQQFEVLKEEHQATMNDINRKKELFSLLEEQPHKTSEKDQILNEKKEVEEKWSLEVRQLEEKLKASQSALETVQMKDCEAMKQLQELQEGASNLLREKNALEQTINALRKERDQLQEDVQKNIIKSIEKEDAQCITQEELELNKCLVDQFKNQTAAYSIHIDKNSAGTQTASSLEEKLFSLMEELQHKTSEKDHILNEKKEVEERCSLEIRQLEEKLKASESALQTVQMKDCEAMKQLQELQDGASNLLSEKTELEETINALRTERDQLQKDVQKNIIKSIENEEAESITQEELDLNKCVVDQFKNQTAEYSINIETNSAGVQKASSLEEKLLILMEDLQQKKSEKELVLKEREELEQRLSCEMRQLKERLNACESSFETVKKEKCAATQKLQQVQVDVEDLIRGKTELEQIMDTLKAERDSLKKDAQKNCELLSTLKEDLQKKTNEKENILMLKKELEQKLSSDIRQLEERLKSSESAFEMLKGKRCAELQELRERETDLTSEMTQMEATEETLKVEGGKHNEDAQMSLRQSIEIEDALRMAQEELAQQKCVVNELRHQIEVYSLSIQDKSLDVATVSSLEEKLLILMEDLQQKTSENEHILKEREELEQRLSSEMRQLKERLNACESSLETVKKEKCAATQKLQEVQVDVEDLIRGKTELEQIMDTLKAESDSLKEDAQKKCELLSTLMEDLQEKTNEKENILMQKKELEQKFVSDMRQLEERLKASESAFEMLKGEHCAELQVLRERDTDLTSEIAQMEATEEALKVEGGKHNEDAQKNLRQSMETEDALRMAQEELAQQKYVVKELRHQIDAYSLSIQEKSVELATVSSLEEKLSTLMEDLQEKINEKENITMQKKELEQKLSSDIRRLEERLKSSESAFEMLKGKQCAELQELRERETDVTSEITQMEAVEEAPKVEGGKHEVAQKNLRQSVETEDALRMAQEELAQQKCVVKELRNQIDAYSLSIRDKSVELATVSSLEEKLSNLMEDLQQKTNEREHLLMQNKDLERRLASEMQQLERLKASESALEIEKGENGAATCQLQELRENVADLTREKSQLEEMKESLKAERDHLNDDVQKKMKRLIETEDELRKSQEALEHQKCVVQELSNQIKVYSLTVEEKSVEQQTISSLEEKLSNLMEDLQQKTNESEHILLQNKDLEQRLASEMQHLVERLKASESALEIEKGENGAAMCQLQELREYVADLTREKSQLEEMKESLKAERGQLNDDVQKNLKILIETEDELRKTREELEHQKCLVQELNNQIKVYSLTVQEKSEERQTISSLEEKLSNLMDDLQQKTNEREHILMQNKDLEQRLASEMQQLEEKLKASESALEIEKGENGAATCQLQELRENVADLTRGKSQLEEMKESLKTERDHLNDDVQKNLKRLIETEDELRKTKEELEHQKCVVQELSNQIKVYSLTVEEKSVEQQTISNLEEKLRATEDALKRTVEELGQHKQLVDDLRNQMSTYSLNIQETSIKIQTASSLEAKLSSLTEELQQKVIERDNVLGQREELMQEKLAMISEVNHLQEKLSANVDTLECVKVENIEALKKIQELQMEIGSLIQTRDVLQQAKETLQTERDQLKEDIQENVLLSIETQDELRQTLEDLKLQKELVSELRSKVAELSVCIEEQSSTIQATDSLEQKLRATEDALKRTLEELGQQNQLVDELRNQISTYSLNIQETSVKLQTASTLEAKLSSLTEELQQKVIERDNVLGQREELRQEKLAMISEVNHLQEKLSANVDALECVKVENIEALKKIQELQTEIGSLIQTRDELQQAKETLQTERDQLKEDIQENVLLSIETQDELRQTLEDLKFQKELVSGLRSKVAELSVCIEEQSSTIQATDSLDQKVSILMEELQCKVNEKDQIANEKRQQEQSLMSEMKQLEEELKASQSALEIVERENCALTLKLQDSLAYQTDLTREKSELEEIEDTLRVEIELLKKDVQKNLLRSTEAEEGLKITKGEFEQQKQLVDELQKQIAAYSLCIQEKSAAIQTASFLEEKLMSELKKAESEVLNAQQKIEDIQRRESDLLNQLSSQDHLLKQQSEELREEIKRNKELSEQVALMEEDISVLRSKQKVSASSKIESEIDKQIGILEEKNMQFKVLLKKLLGMFMEYNRGLDVFSQELLQDVATQKERMDFVKATLPSTLSRPIERLMAENLKLNSQLQVTVKKLKFLCNDKLIDDQYVCLNNFQIEMSNEKKKQIDLELHCTQKHGNTWKAASEQMKNKELQCLESFVQKSVPVEQFEMDLSEIEKGMEGILHALQEEIASRKEIKLFSSCTESNVDGPKLTAMIQLEINRLAQFIQLQNEQVKTLGRFNMITKARNFSKLCDDVLHEKQESNRGLLKMLHDDAVGAGGHIAVEENQRLFNQLNAAQEELENSQKKILNLEHELSVAQRDGKQKEERAISLEKQLFLERHKFQTKLIDGEKMLQSVMSKVQSLQAQLETGSKPYMEEIDQLNNQLVKISMEKTKLSKYTDKEIAFLKSSLEDKGEQLRKLKEELRKARQDQDATVVLEKQHSEPASVTLTCGGGSGIVQSTAMLILKQEKSNLERELLQQKKKYERLLRNEALLKEEILKLREAARKLTRSPPSEASEKHPTASRKIEASIENQDNVSLKSQDTTAQETILLDSPKSSIFDPRSKSLPLARPAQFFDNSSFGTISDTVPAETLPDKDPNCEGWFAPSKRGAAQDCKTS